MIIKFHLKKFCQSIKSFKNVNTLNQLITFTMTNYEKFKAMDFVNAFKVFDNLRINEEEKKIKLYELMDYAFFNENNFSDIDYLKSLIELCIINKMNDMEYLDYIVNLTIKKNIKIFQNSLTFIYFLQKFNQLQIENKIFWAIIEEGFFELMTNFSFEETLLVIEIISEKNYFTTKFKEFSVKFLNEKDKNFNKKSVKIVTNLINNQCKDQNFQIGIFNKYINYKLFDFSNQIKDLQDICIIFPIILIVQREKISNNSNFKEIEDEVLLNLKNIYLSKINDNLNSNNIENLTDLLNKLIDLKFIVLNYEKVKNCFLSSIKSNTFQQNLIFLKYFSLIPEIQIDLEIEKIIKDDLFWENAIEELYHFTLDDEISLLKLILFYRVIYPRIWIILQTSLKRKLSQSSDHFKISSVLELIKSSLDNESDMNLDSLVFTPFLYILESMNDRLIVKQSYL